MQVARIVSDVARSGADMISRVYANLVAWVTARALAALKLPPDVYERIPLE